MAVHPYQIVSICKPEGFTTSGLLLAVCGPKILSVSLEDGAILAQWPENDAATQPEESRQEDQAPPGKKRKLENAGPSMPNVIKLAVTPDQRHAVAVTGDDKRIRVLEITPTGKLSELSQRCMPKRPCAVLVTPDNQTILCGDKFGDVYSLPLLPLPSTQAYAEEPEVPKSPDVPEAKPFTPTATVLTVHSARNRRALENQLKQKNLQAKAKEPLKFEHQLLLGHVSMLTDVKLATTQVGDKARNFIVTADRDEHIRISRGPPNAYVIERFCLGHKEFISKLCLIPGTSLLASGGGDDWIGIWDWTTGELRARHDLRSAMSDSLRYEGKIAVSGLWALEDGATLLVACEKVPGLVMLSSVQDSTATGNIKAISLPAAPLNATVSGDSFIVSLDVTETSSSRLAAYTVSRSSAEASLVYQESLSKCLEKINALEILAPRSEDMLYGVENLRKRGDAEDGHDEP